MGGFSWAIFARAALFLAFVMILSLSALPLKAQEGGGGDLLSGDIFSGGSNLFPNDGRIKVLVVSLNTFGLTETAAEQIGLILQKNLNNSGHFAVIGPREMNTVFENDRPDLVDCREIACGVEAGKRLGADQVLVGSISMVDQRFSLRIRLIDTLNNITHYDEEIRFGDESMDENLFRLSNNISRNSVLTGRVLSTSIRGIVISLGKKHGIKIGDFLVVYKQEVPINDLQGEQLDTQKKIIAIVKVLNVNKNTSEAILAHFTEEPQVSHYAQTYLDPVRQIELVENTRRELDTGLRLENRIKPLELAPVLLADNEKKQWQNKMLGAENSEFLWYSVAAGAGVAVLYFLQDFSASDTNRIKALAAIGGAGYSVMQALEYRELVNEVKLEGRTKGYLGQLNVVPWLLPDRVGVSLALKF